MENNYHDSILVCMIIDTVKEEEKDKLDTAQAIGCLVRHTIKGQASPFSQ
jgi:hypothetical protein